jgi:hypothetical protein
MDTCLAALQLMVYYRYLPTTRKEAVTPPFDTGDVQIDTGDL